MNALDLRPSPIAGTWYESDPGILARNIDQCLASAKNPNLNGQVVGVIAPHAGYRYSGAVAAHAFATLKGLKPDLVVILAPYHNMSQHALLTTSHAAYTTPLGNLPVNAALLADLQESAGLSITPIARDREHSLEIELPFLQRTLKNNFRLLPIMIHAQEQEVAQKLGKALASTLADKNFILIASTDLSHFYDQKTANALDHEMLRRFESFDPAAIFEAEQTGKGFACGHAAVAAMLWAAKGLGATHVQTLHYATSGDVTGDHSSVVGYGAAAVLKKI